MELAFAASSINAATPATKGADMEVPLRSIVVPPTLSALDGCRSIGLPGTFAALISTPGARISGLILLSVVGPRLENTARPLRHGPTGLSQSATAPTVIGRSAAAGLPI